MNKEMISKISTITLFLLSFSPFAIPNNTLLRAKNLTDGETLVSPKSVFELGFFNPGSSSNRFVGVWFTVSPDTVVWVANRNCPLNNTSGTLTLNKRGSIILSDSTGRTIWSSSSNSSSDANNFSPILELNDSGNLILKDQMSNSIIWQSFDHPTNTLLSGMKVGKNLRTGFETYLSSWKSSDDPSEGNYRYEMDTEGAPEIITWDRSQIFTRTGIWNGEYFSGAPQMLTYKDMFNFSFVWDQDEVSYGFEAKSNSTLSRLVLNETGIIQRFVWDQPHQTWNDFWLGTKDECSQYARCGPFSICQRDDMQACSCLRGFEPLTPMEWYMRNTSGGCKRMLPLGCSANSDGFYPIEDVKVPYSHNATVDKSISVEECRNRCLMNCSCMAYAPLDIRGQGSGCVMWQTVLTDTKYIGGGQVLYVKVSKSELVETGRKKRQSVRIGIILTSTIVLLLVTSLAGIIVWRKKLRQDNLEESGSLKDTELPIYDLATVAASTGNFSPSNVLGQGGFGVVYKGELPSGEEIAVKRLSKNSSQGLNEFMNEVMLIAKLQHRNLVRLLGCCIHGSERMLIYEYMTNKSLDFFIFDKERRTLLNWRSRMEIIIGIARGLLYLHQDSRFNIIHRDLKAANILLNGEMTPKISDFGTARLFRQEQTEIATETVVGTRGYMSPEYAMEGKISVKSDVFSFGVLLLEIISGKRNNGSQNLLAYAWMFWEEGKAIHIADESIIDISSVQSELARCVHVGLLCVQECADDRPTMSAAILMLLNEGINLTEPKKPAIGKKITDKFKLTDELALCEYQFYSINEETVSEIEGR